MKSIRAMAFLAAALAAPGALAAPKSAADILRALREVPPPELPAKAAELVNTAPREDRRTMAATVLQTISQTQPGSVAPVRSALVNSGALPPQAKNDAKPVTPVTSTRGGGNDTPNTPNEHSRFPIAPPHGGNPPGHNGQPDRHGPPAFVDYSKPRGF